MDTQRGDLGILPTALEDQDSGVAQFLPMPPSQGPPLPAFLGIYWPWFELPEAEIVLYDLDISPLEVMAGQPVQISITAYNIGAERGSKTIRLGGDFVVEKTVTLDPGQSKQLSFTVTPKRAGIFSIDVNGVIGSFTATEAPLPPPPPGVADIRVSDLIIEPTEVYVGETVNISVTAINLGDILGSKTITCTVI